MSNFSTLFSPVSVTIANISELNVNYQTLAFDEDNQNLSIANGNVVSLSGLAGTGREDVNTLVIENSGSWNEAYNIGTAYQAVSSTFLTFETDSQTLTYTESSAELSISNGNFVSLSALSGQNFNQSLNTTDSVEFNQINANVYLSGGTNLFNLLSSSGGGTAANEVRSDFVSPYTYTGLAVAGTLESTAAWTIRRSEYDSSGSYVSTLTAGFVKWEDRLISSYS